VTAHDTRQRGLAAGWAAAGLASGIIRTARPSVDFHRNARDAIPINAARAAIIRRPRAQAGFVRSDCLNQRLSLAGRLSLSPNPAGGDAAATSPFSGAETAAPGPDAPAKYLAQSMH
jgi:hypothetical protein